jgi:chromate transporter
VTRLAEVFLVFLRLGCTSFGGPIAHIGYFRTEFVTRRKWLDEPAFAAIVGFCQFIPGPASSQVGMALGLMRAGVPGTVAAFLGFTAPSAALMIGFAFLLERLGDVSHAPWVHGLKLAAVAVVAQAVWSMARTLAPDIPRALIALAAAALVLVLPTTLGQMATIALAGLVGWAFLPKLGAPPHPPLALAVPRMLSALALLLFSAVLFGLPFAAPLDHRLAVIDAFYRTGALVFGGGHVVLPLLQQAVVAPGWVDSRAFLAGYGAAQALPGPLFSFAAFLGAELRQPPNGIAGALLALAAIYLPSFLLVFGALPLWQAAARLTGMGAALAGINAAVVGLLLAALYSPVGTGAVLSVSDALIALLLFVLLVWRRVPSWLVVALAVVFATLATAL